MQRTEVLAEVDGDTFMDGESLKTAIAIVFSTFDPLHPLARCPLCSLSLPM